MQDDVGVGVAFEAARIGDSHSAEQERACRIGGETVRILPHPYPEHALAPSRPIEVSRCRAYRG
jgi:hypothetical protein